MKYNILYVDDEKDNLTAFKAVFRRHYNVHLAESGMEALNILKEIPIHLVVSDQRMPKMTGVELFEKIKDEYPDIVRMVLTGYSDMQAIVDAINKGKVYHYITKPWNVDEFKVLMDNALEAYSLRLKNRQLEKERQEFQIKAAQQEKDNILAQFEILKNQINPHFLFNSMNILAALIPENPEKAIEFTNRFSKLYRSVLQLRPQMIISLEEELEFVKSYIYLQKMRFDESLQVDIDIPVEKLENTLPPFALQILVENAVKHNIVSEDNPLKINILNEGDFLLVINNLQLRKNIRDSSGIGITNLQDRYALITPEEIVLKKTDDTFIAKIPLIAQA